MNAGFIIAEIRVTGPSAEPAFVRFNTGLNVISGPSNTGKTFIFQCLNYMLGSSKAPKKIKAAVNYSHCYLEILTSENISYTLKSDLKGGDFELFDCKIPEAIGTTPRRKLSRTHSDDSDDNVSQFLLSACKLTNKKVKINADGKKRGLSFRDIARYLLIDEVRIITDGSPIVSGQYTTATVEKSVFRLLISGIDDSDIIEKVSKDQIKHRKSKIEMLNELVTGLDREIGNLNVQDYESGRSAKINENVDGLKAELMELNAINEALLTQKVAAHAELQETSELLAELTGIQMRSDILSSQYDSDASRLESTVEACQLLNSGTGIERRCPVCNSDLKPQTEEPPIDDVLVACQKELEKISLLKAELEASQIILKHEMASVAGDIETIRQKITAIDLRITSQVQSQISDKIGKITALQQINETLKRYESLIQRREGFITSRDAIARSISQKRGKNTDDSTSSTITPLCEEIKRILNACRYPDLTVVSYNEAKDDFIISGEDRELAGKGHRAITYSAFIMGLQKLVQAKQYGIGIPVLDSPVVTYRKPDAGNEGISIDLAMDFYRYLASSNLPQIIVLENEEPPGDIENSINHIVFTRSTDNGRYGFIPVSQLSGMLENSSTGED